MCPKQKIRSKNIDENVKKDLYNLKYSENFNIQNNEEENIDIELIESQSGSCTVTG